MYDSSVRIQKKRQLTIPAGGMYQECDCLANLVEEYTAKWLEGLAYQEGWKEVRREEIENMGYDELVRWSVPETDVLILIGERYLICLNKDDYVLLVDKKTQENG